MGLFQRLIPAEMIYKWVNRLTIDHRLVEVGLTIKGISFYFCFNLFIDSSDGRRSDPPRDSTSYSSMCSGNGNSNSGSSLSPTDYFCSGMFVLSINDIKKKLPSSFL